MNKFNKKIIPKNYHNNKFILNIADIFIDIYKNESYSQEGENLILKRIFENKKTVFFVDIGSHHPKRFSNTYIFYKAGWSGINIDAMPCSMKLFKKHRKHDINIEAVIADTQTEVSYFSFKESALNTINYKLGQERKQNNELLKVYKMQTKTLAQILDEYIPPRTQIDFMTIDVEDADFEVLKSNNWEKYSPEFVLVEIRNSKLKDIFENKIYLFLKDSGYSFFAKTVNTIFFKLDK